MTDERKSKQRRIIRLLGAFLAAAAAAAVLWHFHDRFWWPPDDGAYAHVAQRLAHGEVLHGDVQDVHFGYIHFANALALRLFGEDLVSLRYPLVGLGVFQTVLAYLLFLRRGLPAALGAAAVATAFSFVQFLNPTAHWYCLPLFFAAVCWLTWRPRGARWRLEVAGLLVGLMLLFRQLSGVMMGVGVIAFLIAEAPSQTGWRALASRLVAALLGAGLAAYLALKTDLWTMAVYGIWPLAVLLAVGVRHPAGNKEVLLGLLRLAAGGAVAALPLVAYHAWHGTLHNWLDDTVFAAEALTRLEFFDRASYPSLIPAAAMQLTQIRDVPALVNGLFWIAALLAPVVLGARVFHQVGARKGAREEWETWEDDQEIAAVGPLPMLALFYFVVSLHFAIPIYLFYTLGPVLLGLLWHAELRQPNWRVFALSGAVAMSAVALLFHAGQPLSRGIGGVLAGERRPTVPADIRRCSLDVEPADAIGYARLLELIERETSADDAILALPSSAELYFLSGRRNPCRFFNSALGMRTRDDLEEVRRTLEADPPRLVFFRPRDKYTTPLVEELMQGIRGRYERLPDEEGLEIYRRPGPRPQTMTAHSSAR